MAAHSVQTKAVKSGMTPVGLQRIVWLRVFPFECQCLVNALIVHVEFSGKADNRGHVRFCDLSGVRVMVKMNHDMSTKKSRYKKRPFSMHRYVGAYVFIDDP